MAADLVERVDFFRLAANRGLEGKHKAALGQFTTPAPIARLMASLLRGSQEEVRLLDAGAGVGSLFAAALAELCCRTNKPRRITVTCYEIDPHFACYLSETMQLCRATCERAGIRFAGEIVRGDFLAAAAERLTAGL